MNRKAVVTAVILFGIPVACGSQNDPPKENHGELGGNQSGRGGGAGSSGTKASSASEGGKSSGAGGREVAGEGGESGGGNEAGSVGDGRGGGGGAKVGGGGGQGKGGAAGKSGNAGGNCVDCDSSKGGSKADAGPGAGGRASDGGPRTDGSTGTGGGPSSSDGFSENSGSGCGASAGATKTNKKLPDPFAMHDGSRITTKAQWECRRNEIKADLEKYEIGPKPEPPKVEATYSGSKLSVTVTTSSGSMTLTSTVSGSGNCVAIGMNGNSSMVSGCTQVPFMHDQVVFEDQNGSRKQGDPFYKVYPDLWNKVGNYSAWSWGISRLIDGIVQVKDQMKVDPTKIAVHGCSYAGKMALFAGALDERIALTVAEESGGGGINAWRTSQDFVTRTGTSIEKIDNTNYSWFLQSMQKLDPYSLPHDHHELIGMIAPRAVIILGNADYDWLGDESGYKSTMAAAEIFKAMGVADSIGYDFTSGHGHCQPPATQKNSVNTFVDRFLKGTSTTSNVAIKPTSSKFDLDYTKVIDWTAPSLQ